MKLQNQEDSMGHTFVTPIGSFSLMESNGL